MTPLIGYLILFLASLISGISVLFIKDTHSKILKYIAVFGGAFLLAVCFVDLIPAMFDGHNHGDHSCEHEHGFESILPVGAFVLIGFLIQLLLELLSKGAEHGHVHSNHKNTFYAALMLLLGVSIHAFLEGFALVSEGKINTSLLTGVVIHNIPISMILTGAFIHADCGKIKSMLLLSVFALMGVLGSLLNVSWDFLHSFERYIIALVVGILLHVSTTTLFDSEESHVYNIWRFLIVIIAFIIVIILPSHH